jgi:hypothetical protein
MDVVEDRASISVTTGKSEPSAVLEEVTARTLAFDETYRHWSPTSQSYTTAEVFLQYLHCGWECLQQVTVKVSRCTSSQCIELYLFEIIKGDQQLYVPVISNPVILRFVRERRLVVTYCEFNSESSR